jgi:hypothetical protein
MDKRASLFYNIFMTVIFSTIFSFIGQLFSAGTIVLERFLLSIPAVGIVAFCVISCLPLAKWGTLLAGLLKIKPNTLGEGMIISFLFSLMMLIIMSPTGAIFNMTIRGGLPIGAALAVCYKGWEIFLPMTWGLSILISPLLSRLAIKLFPAPADGCGNEN